MPHNVDLNLATLPIDIITNIIRMDEESLESMHLISRSWNVCVHSYLRDLRYKPSLERVFLRGATEADFPDDDNDENAPNPHDHVCMWAIVPDKCSRARIGLDNWLTVVQTFNNAIEVTFKTPQKVMVTGELKKVEEKLPRFPRSPPLFALTAATYAFLNQGGYLSLLGASLIAVPTVIELYRSAVATEPQTSQDINEVLSNGLTNRCLTRFFSSFSRIQQLELDGSPTYLEIRSALKTMGNLPVQTLKISAGELNETNQKSIVELVQFHRIEHILIRISFLRKQKFDDFIHQMVNMCVRVDIYEILRLVEPERRNSYFHRSSSYWTAKANELAMDGISLQITCKEDTDFDGRLRVHPHYIRTHLNIMSTDQRRSGVYYSLGNDQTRGHRR